MSICRPLLGAAVLATTLSFTAHAQPTLLTSGLFGTSGSTVGPDGALYVPQGALGLISRVDPETGASSTFASLLPLSSPTVGFGGAVDVAFIGQTAYALVTLVGPDLNDIFGPGSRRVESRYVISGVVAACCHRERSIRRERIHTEERGNGV